MRISVYIIRLLLSCGLLACSFVASAQVTVQWDKTYGGNLWEQFHSVVSAADGGYLLAGYSNSPASGDKSEDSKAAIKKDYWIVKTDANGNKLWDKTIGSVIEEEEYLSVIATADGGYLLVGESDSNASGDKSEDSKGGYDGWIIKIDANGNVLWDKTIGGSNGDAFIDAISTADGGYLLSGSSASPISGDKSEDSKGGNDYWIVKIDASGNVLWDKTIGSAGAEGRAKAIATKDGGYLLSGFSNGNASGDKSENSKGGIDGWIVKVDANGNKLWDKTLGTSNDDYFNDVATAIDGSYLLGGGSYSDASGDKSEDSKGVNDYWVIKLDASGNILWDKTLGGSDTDDLRSIISTTDGSYLVAGYSYSNASGDKTEDNKGGGHCTEEIFCDTDYWIIKLDASGNILWDKTLGGSEVDYLRSIISTTDGGYLVAGYSYSNASGDKTEDNKGIEENESGQGREDSGDYWIVKIIETPEEEAAIRNLTLVNAETDENIQELRDGDVINLAATGNILFNVRASTVPQKVDYVKLQLSGPVAYARTEREQPYALFGDRNGNYNGRRFQPGTYSLTATPYSNDIKGTPHTISFRVVKKMIEQSFTLVNAETYEDIGELKDGDVITRNILFNVRANTVPQKVDYVRMRLSGPVTYFREESQQPYALFGDRNGNYNGKSFQPGMYSLTATPYSNDIKGIPYTISFQVVWQAGNTAVAKTAFQVYPIPTAGEVHVVHASQHEQQLLLLDDKGKVVLSRLLPQQAEQVLDLSSYKKGLYYLRIISKEAVETKRIVVE